MEVLGGRRVERVVDRLWRFLGGRRGGWGGRQVPKQRSTSLPRDAINYMSSADIV